MAAVNLNGVPTRRLPRRCTVRYFRTARLTPAAARERLARHGAGPVFERHHSPASAPAFRPRFIIDDPFKCPGARTSSRAARSSGSHRKSAGRSGRGSTTSSTHCLRSRTCLCAGRGRGAKRAVPRVETSPTGTLRYARPACPIQRPAHARREEKTGTPPDSAYLRLDPTTVPQPVHCTPPVRTPSSFRFAGDMT